MFNKKVKYLNEGVTGGLHLELVGGIYWNRQVKLQIFLVLDQK